MILLKKIICYKKKWNLVPIILSSFLIPSFTIWELALNIKSSFTVGVLILEHSEMRANDTWWINTAPFYEDWPGTHTFFVYYRGCRHSVRVLSLLILRTAGASKYHCNSFLPFFFSLFSVCVTLFFYFLNRHLLWLHGLSSFGGHLQWTKVQSP